MPLRRCPSVELKGVTARYGRDEPAALEDFDLRLDPGSRVALVGPSGAGKTTVTNLLLRFLDPEKGRVTLGGHPLSEYRQDEVRATFALAGQEAHVFDSTIRANLLLAKPGATEAELDLALRRARLRDWVASLPDGLETLVGEDGSKLSGGQRQRLTMPARSSPTRPFSSSTSRPRTSTRRPPARLSKTPSNHPEVARSCSSLTVPKGSTASRTSSRSADAW